MTPSRAGAVGERGVSKWTGTIVLLAAIAGLYGAAVIILLVGGV